MQRSTFFLLCCVLCSGCITPKGSGGGKDITFESIPPQSAQTESLCDVRFRRFVRDSDYVASEWTREPSIWPLVHPERAVISRFGPRGRSGKLHKGIDIKAPRGAELVVTADGEVTYAGRRGAYGNFIQVNHGDGVVSAYGHCDKIWVEVGDLVRQGTPIGSVGATGNASTAHVHYEVRIDGQPYDPWLFLPAIAP